MKQGVNPSQKWIVTMAELFWVGSAGRTGKTAIARGGRTWQNYFQVVHSRIG